MALVQGFQVTGLREFTKEIARASETAQAELVKENQAIVAEVKSGAVSLAAGSRKRARGASTLRKANVTAGAAIYLGDAAHPDAYGDEFGSNRFKQFDPWRGNGENAGYFLYPTIRKFTATADTRYLKMMDRVSAKAFPE